jgi:hypothetical protein
VCVCVCVCVVCVWCVCVCVCDCVPAITAHSHPKVITLLESLDIVPSSVPTVQELFVPAAQVAAKTAEAAALPSLAIDELSLQVRVHACVLSRLLGVAH